ncbi:MAG: PD-(D/E)XK nuclease family protein [Bacteroidia bacterium]|nr:PD-(D/E)XK nuclease family protein [Bacteroidia bacterium]
MEYFLEHIAKHLYSEHGNRLNSHCLVFPNRRAGLFFLKYLAAEISQPVWTPAIMTINDLFRSLSELKSAENEILLLELYKVYRVVKKSSESFDDFYFWGDMLLNDFDDVDKYLVDASKLFRNVQDIKEIDQQFGGLSPEQIEIVKRFWVNFDPEKITEQKIEFKSVWSILDDLYKAFRKNLKEKDIAYEGMIFRDVAEDSGRENMSGPGWEMFHFIGFNALNECEKSLMTRLKKTGRAKFYWDFDNSYIKGSKLNSAGYFMRDNIKVFGNDMPGEWSYETLLSKHSSSVKHRIIDTSSDVAQVKLIPELINEIPGLTPENAHETAVILADENLLMPVLTSLPENIPDINITMGYPLRHTSVYTLIKHLLDLQRNAVVQDGIILFLHRDVINILKHSLVTEMIEEKDQVIIREIIEKNLIRIPSGRFEKPEILATIFTRPSSPAHTSGYLKSVMTLIVQHELSEKEVQGIDLANRNIRNEFIYRAILSINRLDTVTASPEISFTLNTWISLLDGLLRNQSVPFSGEPLSGIQIMGILETRSLDFKNLIVLSVNEGIIPAITTGSSFIPFSLREAFGLPSINHRESVYAYHFYRLLQRAENVTFIFNSNPEGLRSGEMSRFLQQMKYDPLLKPEFLNLGFEIRNRSTVSEEIERTEEHQRQLNSRFSTSDKNMILSPTAINMWLNCSMKFYYRYVCGLKEPESITEEIDPALLGTLLHETMKNLYQGFIGKRVSASSIDTILSDKQSLLKLINRTIRKVFSRENDTAATGNELIVTEVLMVYIGRILEADRMSSQFVIEDLERPVRFPAEAGEGESIIRLLAGGNIDRIDSKDGITRILDYKTGAIADSISSVSDLFNENRKKDYDGWLQTLLYCEGYLHEKPERVVRPSVYKVKKAPGENLDDRLLIKESKGEEIPVDDYSAIRHEFMLGLESVVHTIFKSDEPFIMTSDTWGKCSYCPYSRLCLRQ